MKHMSKGLAILLAAALLLCFGACGNGTKEPTTTAADSTSGEATTALGQGGSTLTLVAAWNTEEGDNKEYAYAYDGDLTVQAMADGLAELTGLTFGTLEVTNAGQTTMMIDIPQESALFTGPPEPQKEEFFFFDYDSLAWFMLDSLNATIRKNIPAMGQGVEEYDIYFTMDGGESLVLENLSPPMDFTLESPYMGSAFYFAHQDVRGDEGGRGDYLPENPEDVRWWGEYRGNDGILKISNFDQNPQGDWYFRFLLMNVFDEDDGVAAVDSDNYAVAEYADYTFTFSPGETEDDDVITITGGTEYDGRFPRYDETMWQD